jgi:hypothetical protein
MNARRYRWSLLAGVLIMAAARSADPPVEAVKAKPAPAAIARTAAGPSEVPAPAKVMDRLDLEATQVTGNRELPKVMVIVPWKHADVGAVAGRPANSLMDEVLKPLDRDVMRRELEYYGKVGATSSQSPSKPEN